jgi:hypothetical protein
MQKVQKDIPIFLMHAAVQGGGGEVVVKCGSARW